MLEVDGWLGRTNVDCRMIMQVHDELVFEVAESDIDEVESEVENLMSQSASLTSPYVSVGQGDNWEEALELRVAGKPPLKVEFNWSVPAPFSAESLDRNKPVFHKPLVSFLQSHACLFY